MMRKNDGDHYQPLTKTQKQGASFQHHRASHSCRGDDDDGDGDGDEDEDDGKEDLKTSFPLIVQMCQAHRKYNIERRYAWLVL